MRTCCSRSFSLGKRYTSPQGQRHVTKALSGQIDDLLRSGFGSLFCYDRHVEIEINFDMNLRSVDAFLSFSQEQKDILQQLPLGRLELFVRYPVINAAQRLAKLPPQQIPASAYLVPPYQQIHLALAHWVEVLCLKLHPALAVGYYATNSYFPDEEDFRKGFDIAMISALEQNQLPHRQDWLEHIYLLYVPAQLRDIAQVEEWLSATMWQRQLANDGILAYTMPETPEEIRAKEFNMAGETILKARDRTQFLSARSYLQRAQEIPHVSSSTRYNTSRLFEQLQYMEQNPDLFFEQ